MRKINAFFLLIGLSFFSSILFHSTPAYSKVETVKEWTFLVFLNGKNNLDSFGDEDINEMEKVGSTDEINVVVQWGSMNHGTTRRVYVEKDNNPNQVTSPIIQNMGKVDMGDWRNLVEFVRWAVVHYPAKKYFIDVWDHGSGWHLKSAKMSPKDISWDDETGNFMTTKQLGQAMVESAGLIGHKVDIYGSDACLMAMAEVAGEMSSAVEISVGSEEVEPGEGWPYDALLKEWSAVKAATAQDVAKILTQTYVRSYQNGSQGNKEVTFSALNLTKMEKVTSSMKMVGDLILKFDAQSRKKALRAVNNSMSFSYSDYVDILDFLKQAEALNLFSDSKEVLSQVKSALSEFVIANAGTSTYANAMGVSIWMPTYLYSYNYHAEAYKTMNFNISSGWGEALKYLLQDTSE